MKFIVGTAHRTTTILDNLSSITMRGLIILAIRSEFVYLVQKHLDTMEN